MEWFWIFGGLVLYMFLMFPNHLFSAAKELWLTWTGKSKNIKRSEL